MLFLLVSICLLNIRNVIDLNETIFFVLQTIGAMFVVLSISLYSYKFFTNKILLWFGDLSFEFYLCHFLVLLFFRSMYHDIYSYVIISFIVSVILSLIIKSFSEHIILFFTKVKKNVS